MSEQDPSLDPGQEQRVRALLAGLGSRTGDGADQLPAEVAARLEDTLAGLVAEREAGKISEEHTATGNVVPLRPRWMPRVAAAAAAVIVLGLGALTATNLGRHHDSATSADAGAGTAKAEQVPSASSPGTFDSSGTAVGRRAVDLHAATFTRDVRALLVRTPALRAPARVHGQLSAQSPTPTSGSVCAGPSTTDGSSTTVVRLDAAPAALVVHPAGKGKQLIEAWSCDGTRRLASTTIAP
jgi:hypothetical protein